MMDLGMSQKLSRPLWKFSWSAFVTDGLDAVRDMVISALEQECPVGEEEDGGGRHLRDTFDENRDVGEGYVQMNFTSDAPYVMYVIKGTGPHPIDSSPDGPALHFFASSGDEVFTRHVDHPGTQPNPFHERAWDTVKDDVMILLGQSIRASIT